MTTNHHDDNDDSVFQFDLCNCPAPSLIPARICAVQDFDVSNPPGYMSPHDDTENKKEMCLSGSIDKGKGVTRPLLIPPVRSNNTVIDSVSSLGSPAAESSHSPLVSSPLSQLSISPFNCSSPVPSDRNTEAETYALYPQIWHPQLNYNLDDGKGKEKESPSFLTSPVFNLDHASLEHLVWSSPTSSTPGPSNHSSPLNPTFSLNPPDSQEHITSFSPASSTSHHTQDDLFALKRMPSRRRSLSNLSLSTKPLKVKVKWNAPRIQHNISRVLFKKRDIVKVQSETGPKTDLTDSTVSVFGSLSFPCFKGIQDRFWFKTPRFCNIRMHVQSCTWMDCHVHQLTSCFHVRKAAPSHSRNRCRR